MARGGRRGSAAGWRPKRRAEPGERALDAYSGERSVDPSRRPVYRKPEDHPGGPSGAVRRARTQGLLGAPSSRPGPSRHRPSWAVPGGSV